MPCHATTSHNYERNIFEFRKIIEDSIIYYTALYEFLNIFYANKNLSGGFCFQLLIH